MSASVLYMSMSLDGYIAGPHDEAGNPGGDGFDRLHEWFVTQDREFFRPSGPAGQLMDEINATGAVGVSTGHERPHGRVARPGGRRSDYRRRCTRRDGPVATARELTIGLASTQSRTTREWGRAWNLPR